MNLITVAPEGGVGALLGIFDGGVQLGSPNPDPISPISLKSIPIWRISKQNR